MLAGLGLQMASLLAMMTPPMAGISMPQPPRCEMHTCFITFGSSGKLCWVLLNARGDPLVSSRPREFARACNLVAFGCNS